MIQNYPTETATWEVVAKDGFGDMLSGYPVEFSVPGHFKEEYEMVRNKMGEEVMGTGVFYVHPNNMPAEAYVDDKLTIRSKVYVILSMCSKKGMTGGLVEIRLR